MPQIQAPAAPSPLNPLRPPPHRDEGLLQRVLDRVGRHRAPQPRGEPRRVPGKKLPQCPVVTRCDGSYQVFVTHHVYYLCCAGAGFGSVGGVRFQASDVR